CLEKEKEKRFQSADEVRSELESIEKGIPTKERVAPERKPFTSKEITVQFSVKKLFIPALIFIAVVIIGLTLWQILPREKAFPGFPSDKPSIAVVYFMNQTGDEALDHWREALPRWIITDLSQSKYINVLSADRLFSILRKLNLLEIKNYASEDLKNVANEGRVNHIFQASFSKAGDIFRIDYSLQKGDTLEIIDSDYVTGGNEESFPSLVDNITKKIRVELELSEEQVINDIDREVGTITTNFPEAFKYYSIGEKFKNIAEMEKCIKLMEQAVAIDPEFAMAYRAMAISYSNLGYRTKAIEILQKALSLTDRLSDRERYRIEADFYSRSEKTYDKAFEAYEKLLEIYPDETGARQNLAIRYGVIGEIHKAIEHYEILIREYQTDFYGTYTNLASRYIDLGLYDKAKETLEKFKNNVKDSPIIHGAFAYYYLYQGKYDLALEEIEKTFALDPTDWRIHKGRGDAYYFMGDLEKAEEEYRKLLENEEPVAKRSGILDLGFLFTIKGRYKESIEMEKRMLKQSEELGEKTWIRGAKSALSYMELRSGNPKRALELIEENLESAVEDEHLGDQREALYRKALIFVEMDQLAEAQKAAQELKALIENGMIKNQMWRYYNLMGKIEIERKDFSKAIEYLKKGLPLLFPTSELQMIYADSLGLAYYNSGDFEKAQEEYEKIDLSRGMIDYADIYAKAFYMLGKIHEEKGDKAKAVEHYEKFFDLWKDADPGIAEFGDARKRLAGLKSH
ncbi:MAG: tetratricopeptide repeat protein, partial [Candidatus Hodarchaeota archaeon]